MKFLKREAFKPGVYFKQGQRIEVSPEDCRRRFLSMRALSGRGLSVPLLREHTDPASKAGEGTPGEFNGTSFKYGDQAASELKRTVGAVDMADPRTKIHDDGSIDCVFNVPDAATATQLSDKRIRFTSPELRRSWEDTQTGRVFEDCLTHFALTHRPIQADQVSGFDQVALSSLETAQLSATPAMVMQFAEFEADKGDDSPGDNDSDPDRTVANPNMPQSEQTDEKDLEALVAHLAKLGIDLPKDTKPEDFIRTLLTAVMTFNSAKDRADQEKAEKESSQTETEVEEAMPTTRQFSAESNHGKLQARIVALRGLKTMPEGMVDQMLVQLSSVEFDEKGNEKITSGLSVSGLCDSYEAMATQFAAGSPQAALIAQIDQASGVTITPGQADQLKARVGTAQFSADGQEVAAGGMSIRDFLQVQASSAQALGLQTLMTDQSAGVSATQYANAEEQLMPGAQYSGGAQVAEHSNPNFMQGDAMIMPGDPRAKGLADSLIAAHGVGKGKGEQLTSMVDEQNLQMAQAGQTG